MKINKSFLQSALIFVVINILAVVPLFAQLNRDINLQIGIFAIIQGIASVLILNNRYPLYSLATLFVILSEVFHFGEALLLGLGKNELFSVYNETLAGSQQKYNLANIFALLIQAFLVFGMMVVSQKSKDFYSHRIECKYNASDRGVFKIGLISFLIGVGPNVMYYGKMVFLTMAGYGYVGIRTAVDLGPIQLLTIFFYPGIILMILGLSKDYKNRARIVWIMACLWELFCMLSGNRGKQLTMLLVYVFIYYRFIGKFNLKKIIPAAIISYVGVAFLYYISSNRLGSLGNINNVSVAFLKVLSGEPIYALLAEQGTTLNMVALAFNDVPDYTPFKGGLTYVISLISVFPDTGGWKGNLADMVGTLYYLNTKLPLGDSYIAELYHNFGWISLFFAIFEGCFIGSISSKIEYYTKKGYYLALGSYFVLFAKLLWLVRCNFFNFLYDFVWTWVLIQILKMLFLRKQYSLSKYLTNEGVIYD